MMQGDAVMGACHGPRRWAIVATGGLCIAAALLGAGGTLPRTAGMPGASAQDDGASAESTVIDLGHVEIVGSYTPSFNPCEAPAAPASLTVPPSTASLDEAQHSVDFTIVEPSWLPGATYQLRRVQVSAGDRVTLDYRDTAVDPTAAGVDDLIIYEQPWADVGGEFDVAAVPEKRLIDGRPAAFWIAPPIPCQGAPITAPSFQEAAWERGDLLIEIGGMGLTPDEITRIAESLTEPS